MRPDGLEVAALRALVGDAQVSNAAAVSMLDEAGVTAADCNEAGPREVFAVVEARIRAGEALDAVTIARACKTAPRELVVSVLTDTVLGATRGRLAALKDESLRRQYAGALKKLLSLVEDRGLPVANAVAEATKLLGAWQSRERTIQALDVSLSPFFDTLDAIQRGEKEATVPTGLEAWDALCGGLPATLTVIGALPGVGKSALVAGICRNLARRGTKVGLLSLEDEREWLIQRIVSDAADVPLFILANRPQTKAQAERISETAGEVHGWLGQIITDDRSGMTTAEVVASARQMLAKGAKALILDHLGEVRMERSDRHDLDIADVLRELRTIAKTHHVPVVVLCHLRRREGLDVYAEPRLTDFAFSAGVERMARLAIGLFKSKDNPTELRAVVLKQTRGKSDVGFALRMHERAAIVGHSPASDMARTAYEEDNR
jgi:replicative DNA helicase